MCCLFICNEFLFYNFLLILLVPTSRLLKYSYFHIHFFIIFCLFTSPPSRRCPGVGTVSTSLHSFSYSSLFKVFMTRHLLFHWRRHHHHHNHHNFFLKNIWDWLPLKRKARISHHEECHTQLTISHTSNVSHNLTHLPFFCLWAPFLLLSAAPGFYPSLPDVSQSIFVTSLSFTFLQPFLSY